MRGVMSVGLEGMKGYKVLVEADVRVDKEQCIIIGLPDISIKESKERIISTLYLLDYDISMKKMTVHLSPSDRRKTGTGYDGAMIAAVLQKLIQGARHSHRNYSDN